MSFSIDQLRTMVNAPGISGGISITGQDASAQVAKTGFGHFLKTFFGFKSAQAKNEATLNAIRSAFRDDPKLMIGYNKADSLLKGITGTITAEKVREIIRTVESTISQTKLNDVDKQKSVVNATKGRLAAEKPPKYLVGAGTKFTWGRFMARYSKDIANSMPKDVWKSTEAQEKAIRNAKDCFKAMFDVCGDDALKRSLMFKIVSSSKANPLVNQDGGLKSIDECKTFAKDMLAVFEELEFKDRYVALNALENISHPVSAEELKALIQTGRDMDKTKLDNLFKNPTGNVFAKPEEFPTKVKFAQTMRDFYGAVKSKVAEMTNGKDISTKDLAQMHKLVFQSAINSLNYKVVAKMTQIFSKYAPENSRMDFKEDLRVLVNWADPENHDAQIAIKALRLPAFLIWDTDIASRNARPLPHNLDQMPEPEAELLIDKVKVD